MYMIVAGRKKLLLNHCYIDKKDRTFFNREKKGIACAYTEKSHCDKLIFKFQSMSI